MKHKKTFKNSTFRRIIGSYRDIEYKVAYELFKDCSRVLDVGCGSGGFLEVLHKNGKIEAVGTDLNPDCVDVCLKSGLNVTLGNALDIPYQDNSFDGVYCSHVMQAFTPAQAVTLIKELSRVVNPKGIIVITTIPMHARLFVDPGDVRPYPPPSTSWNVCQGEQRWALCPNGEGCTTISGRIYLATQVSFIRPKLPRKSNNICDRSVFKPSPTLFLFS